MRAAVALGVAFALSVLLRPRWGLGPTWGWESQTYSGFVDWHKLGLQGPHQVLIHHRALEYPAFWVLSGAGTMPELQISEELGISPGIQALNSVPAPRRCLTLLGGLLNWVLGVQQLDSVKL